MLLNNNRWVATLVCLLVVGCSTIAKRSVQSEISAGRYDQAQRALVHAAPHLSSEDYEELYGELCASRGKSALASKDWAGALDNFDCAIQRNPRNQAMREDACTASYNLAQQSRGDLAWWKSVVQRCSGLPEGAGKVDTALREQARVLAGNIEATIDVCRHTSCAGLQNYEAAEDSIQQYEANPVADHAQAARWHEEIHKQKEADEGEQQHEVKLRADEKALAGCYLMVPPRVGRDPRDARRDRVVPDSDAPLSKWYWAGSFDSLDACQRNQEKEIVKAQKRERAQAAAKRDRSVEMDFWEARCIATNDPRLKEE